MTMTQRDISSFGELLKTFRTRQRITQQQLAEVLGMHRHAIGRWEQGEFLPGSKAVVLELARHLRLRDLETRQLLEASLTTLSPHWQVSLPRNPFFTGREEILETLHTYLGTEQVAAFTQSYALHGLGGVGKTQIALEYTHRYTLEYSAVFWIGAETIESIFSSLQRIAEVLQLPERDDLDQEHVLAAVQRWLTTHNQWLLIWDNIEDLNLLTRFMPPSRQGTILLTTRTQALGTLARGINLAPMGQDEGTLLLLRRSKVLGPEATDEQVRQFALTLPGEYTAAKALVTVLGGLPLALDQAGAYIEETGCNLSGYLEHYEKQHARLLDRRGQPDADHPQSVRTTFRLSMEDVESAQLAAADILRVCALLHAEAIPEELFVEGAAHLGPALAALREDASQFDQAIATLRRLSLVQRQPETHTLSLHRLVQTVLLDTMAVAERAQWSRRVLAALDEVFPEVQAATGKAARKQCERLLPHALLSLRRDAGTNENLAFASLAYKVAQYMRERGAYTEAEPLFLQALHIREQTLGPNDTSVAQILHCLAGLYLHHGKYAEAEPLFRRALHIREQTLGPQHLLVANSLNGLAGLSWTQGQYTEAETLLLRALHISEQALSPDHFDVARVLNNLAKLYCSQGKYAEAEPLLLRALHISEQTLGSEHPQVAYSLNNLAELYMEQGQYTEAKTFHQQALSIREQTLGSEHPQVAYSLNNLAELSMEQGQYTEAEPLYQRALYVLEQCQEFEPPDLAISLRGLANVLRNRGNYTEAEPLYQRALSLQEQHLGWQHPATAQTLHDLAIFHQMQAQLDEAIALATSALSMRSKTLGDAHLKTIATQALYTQLVQETERVSLMMQPELPDS